MVENSDLMRSGIHDPSRENEFEATIIPTCFDEKTKRRRVVSKGLIAKEFAGCLAAINRTWAVA